MSQTKCPEEYEGLIPTLNNMGYMNTQSEPYNRAFIEYAATCEGPCLEVGAAYGVSTLQALEKGACMIANDLCADHLEVLWQKTPESLRSRLTLMPGAFPDELNIEPKSVDAILSSKMLNFIEPIKIEEAFANVHRWLKKGGKFFLVVATPFIRDYWRFLPQYFENLTNNKRWPGFIEDTVTANPEYAHILPPSVHLMDEQILLPLLTKTGFVIEQVGYSGVPDKHPEEMKGDGREFVGIIARAH